MRHSLLPTLILLALVATPANGQGTPKGLRRSLDGFTGDTVVMTDYGRLDDRSGCGRLEIAIILGRQKGARGTVDMLTYQWIKIDDPFSGRAYWLNGMSAFLNIAGEIVELERGSQSPRLKGSGSSREEDGTFLLPREVLERIAATPGVKLRIKGTEHTCDGTLEPNITARASLLVKYLPVPASAPEM